MAMSCLSLLYVCVFDDQNETNIKKCDDLINNEIQKLILNIVWGLKM